MNTQRLRAYLACKAQKDGLKEQLKTIDGKLKVLGEEISEEMQLEGVRSVKTESNTIFLQRELRCSLKADHKTEAQSIAAELGIEGMLTLQPQSFSAYCKEFLNRGDPLPELLTDKVSVYDHDVVRSRKA